MRILTLTEINNVDMENRCVIDNSKVFIMNFNDHDSISVFDVVKNEQISIDISDVSLYANRLVMNEKLYHILHMLSK